LLNAKIELNGCERKRRSYLGEVPEPQYTPTKAGSNLEAEDRIQCRIWMRFPIWTYDSSQNTPNNNATPATPYWTQREYVR
jgi:hypothetical protein